MRKPSLIKEIIGVAGLVLIIFSIPLPFQKIYRLSTIYPCDVVFPLIFFAWLVHALIKKEAQFKGKKIFLFFLPLIIAGIISGINAKDYFRLTGYIYLWAQIPLAYIMAVNIIKNRHSLNVVFYSSLTAIVLFSGFYIFYFLKFHRLNIEWGEHIFFQKNIIASYIGLGPPLFLGLIFFKSRPNQKILLTILMAISLAGLLFTTSHWGNFSLALSLVFFILFFIQDKDTPRDKYRLLFISLLFSVCFIYLYFFDQVLYNRLFNANPDSDSFIGGRIEIYKFAIALFKQHPMIGIGIGNFRDYHGSVHSHNVFFQLLAEIGLIGLGAFSFLLWNLIRYLIKVVKACPDRHRYIIYGGIASLAYFFVYNTLDFTLGHGIGIQLGIILAIIEGVKDPNFA